MTREEAINKLVNARYADEFQGDEELTTAHLMAIKALEQEPCEDCVSRQTVMEYIKNCTIDLGYENGTNMVLDVISNMPSIQPKTDVLDKIRAEIEGLTYYCCEVHPRNVIDDVLEIIDKYKAETEAE